MRPPRLVLTVTFAVLASACGSIQDPPGTDGAATSTTPTSTTSPTTTATTTPTPTVTASAPPTATVTTTSSTPAPTTSSAPGRKLSKEGEICGGIAGFMCEPGLVCSMTKPTYPDQAGKCQKR